MSDATLGAYAVSFASEELASIKETTGEKVTPSRNLGWLDDEYVGEFESGATVHFKNSSSDDHTVFVVEVIELEEHDQPVSRIQKNYFLNPYDALRWVAELEKSRRNEYDQYMEPFRQYDANLVAWINNDCEGEEPGFPEDRKYSFRDWATDFGQLRYHVYRLSEHRG